jgi:hypothetical protein
VTLESNVLLLLHVQAYLAVIVVTTLFAASLLNERQDAAEETEAWRRRHETVIRASGNLLYEDEPGERSILWDGDTQAVLASRPARSRRCASGWARASRRPHAPEGPARSLHLGRLAACLARISLPQVRRRSTPRSA